jgi:cardiolipin synthase
VSTAPTRPAAQRIATVPNALSALRIACIPLFAWLVLVVEADGWAVAVLIVAAVSDFLDGALARRWGQESALGRLLDPFADRLTSIVVPVVLAIRDIVPWWFVVLLFVRDAVVAVAAFALLRTRKVSVDVNFLGKAATFCLLIGLPLLLLGTFAGVFGATAHVLGWAFTVWGAGLYWWSAWTYVVQIRALARESA